VGREDVWVWERRRVLCVSAAISIRRECFGGNHC
jgi:hypothetical protein